MNVTQTRDTDQGRYVCASPEAGDDAAIRRLLRQPMPGRVSIAMPHEPDHRAAMQIAGDRVEQVVVRDKPGAAPYEDVGAGGHVVGYGYRAVRSLYVNGQVRRVGYLGGMRCEAQLRAAFRVLGRSFEALDATRWPDEAGYDLTSIMADNTVVRRGLEKGLPGLPAYVPIGQMLTLTMKTRAMRGGNRQAGATRVASMADAPNIKRLLDETGRSCNGRPVWPVPLSGCSPDHAMPAVGDFVVSERGGNLIGCLAVWDQRAARQVVVADLSPSLARCRGVINAAAWLSGRPGLPAPGSSLPMAYASHAGFDLSDAQSTVVLLRQACTLASARGIKLLSIGLPADAPVTQVVIKHFHPWVSTSVIYAVTHKPDAVDLDARPFWMEVATL